jgi:hypothetical protein
VHRKTVRWIAALTLAGTGVLASATAASAAVATPHRAPREGVSPATCTALATDVSATLADLTKKLASANADPSGAMTVAADLARLLGAAQALGCPATAAPAAPAPTAGSVPGASNLAGAIGSIPGAGTASGALGTPSH